MFSEAAHLIVELGRVICWLSNSFYVKTEDFYLKRTNSGPKYIVNESQESCQKVKVGRLKHILCL